MAAALTVAERGAELVEDEAFVQHVVVVVPEVGRVS